MRTRVMATGMQPTRAVREFAHQRLNAILGRHVDDLEHADVFLEDLNGPKGGRDMSVRVRARLRGGRIVTVEETCENLHAAIARACKRAAFAVRRTLGEARRIDRRGGRQARRGGIVDPMDEAIGLA